MLRRQKHTMFRDRIGLSIETGADPSYKKAVTTSTPPSEQNSKPMNTNQSSSKVDEDGHPVFELSPSPEESSSPEATSPSP